MAQDGPKLNFGAVCCLFVNGPKAGTWSQTIIPECSVTPPTPTRGAAVASPLAADACGTYADQTCQERIGWQNGWVIHREHGLTSAMIYDLLVQYCPSQAIQDEALCHKDCWTHFFGVSVAKAKVSPGPKQIGDGTMDLR